MAIEATISKRRLQKGGTGCYLVTWGRCMVAVEGDS